jgi:hypothetical protein
MPTLQNAFKSKTHKKPSKAIYLFFYWPVFVLFSHDTLLATQVDLALAC